MNKKINGVFLVIFCAFIFLCVFPCISIANDYTIIDLGTISGVGNSSAKGINSKAQVVGESHSFVHWPGAPFFWDPVEGPIYGMEDIGNLGDGTGRAYAINDLGQVVGVSDYRAFLWDRNSGTTQDLGNLGGSGGTTANDINNAGQVVGVTSPSNPSFHYVPFLWDPVNGMQQIANMDGVASSINESGQVVGSAEADAFIWDSENGFRRLPGIDLGGVSSANAINDLGQVVGIFNDRPFIWDENNSLQYLSNDPNVKTTPFAINNVGQVVGAVTGSPFLWNSGKGFQDLNDLVPSDSGWGTLEAVYDINDAGQMVGYGELGSGGHAFLMIPMPQATDVLYDNNMNIEQDELIEILFFINCVQPCYSWKAVIKRIIPGSDVETRLIQPDGTEINRSTQDNNIQHFLDSTQEIYIVSEPMAGEWKVRLIGTDTAADGEDTSLLIYLNEPTITNQPPTAQCQDVSVSTELDLCTAAASIDAGSFDPDGDPITLEQAPIGPYALGITDVTLTVTDDQGASNTCTSTVTVQDTTAPVPDVAELPEVRGECSAAVASPPTATDNCAGTLAGTTSDPLSYTQLGTYTVTWTFTDSSGNESTQTQTVVVEDTTPPVIDSLTVSPDTLWPPNHKMVNITPIVAATDNCDANPQIKLLSITMNEGEETNTYDPEYDDSQGDGNTIDDIQVDENGNIFLRAERSGKSTGRVYTLTYEAEDSTGNISTATATVTVPHDMD